MSSKKQISVSVSNISGRSAPLSEFKWGKLTSALKIDRVEEEISKRLFSDGRVIAILKRAFEQGLSRNLTWNISEVDLDATSAFRIAASVFQRGVSVTDSRCQVKPESKAIISYDVKIVTRRSDCFISAGDRDMIIVDQNVANSWERQLPKGFVAFTFAEANKNTTTAAEIADLIRGRMSPDSRVFVVGGGVAGDVVGFATGILGVKCHYVPTTLLSMADSSIGGKVAVNFEPWGKNQIGLFHHPQAVYIWPGWLETLGEKELKSGLVECLKHALISGDETLWTALSKPKKTFNINSDFLETVIQVKRGIVEIDPYETGERAVLNFGHTLGHALETAASSRGIAVTHGECVAIGMIHALRLSSKYRGMAAGSYVDDLLRSGVVMPKAVLKELNDGVHKGSVLSKQLIELMSRDKKASINDSISFVLMDSPGQIARAEGNSWVIQFPRQGALADLEETLSFLLTLSY